MANWCGVSEGTTKMTPKWRHSCSTRVIFQCNNVVSIQNFWPGLNPYRFLLWYINKDFWIMGLERWWSWCHLKTLYKTNIIVWDLFLLKTVSNPLQNIHSVSLYIMLGCTCPLWRGSRQNWAWLFKAWLGESRISEILLFVFWANKLHKFMQNKPSPFFHLQISWWEHWICPIFRNELAWKFWLFPGLG